MAAIPQNCSHFDRLPFHSLPFRSFAVSLICHFACQPFVIWSE
jgi:hypothetical protein